MDHAGCGSGGRAGRPLRLTLDSQLLQSTCPSVQISPCVVACCHWCVCEWVNVAYSQFTIYYLLFIIYHLLFNINHILFTIYHVIFNIYHLPFSSSVSL